MQPEKKLERVWREWQKNAEKGINVIPVTNFPVTLTYILGAICERPWRRVASRDTEKRVFFKGWRIYKIIPVARSDQRIYR